MAPTWVSTTFSKAAFKDVCQHLSLGKGDTEGDAPDLPRPRPSDGVHCSHTTRGHRTDHEAAGLVFEALAALADIRELLWPIGDPNASWSPDTIDQVARRLEFLRTGPNYPAADAVRYSGSVRIELSYDDSDGCYDGKVIVDGHTYTVSVGPPAIGYGPGIAYDSADAYDRAAHAALSFAAADLDWGDGCDISTPAADIGPNGWIIRRTASSNHR